MLFRLRVRTWYYRLDVGRYARRYLSFMDMCVDKNIVRRLRSFGIQSPTYIQEQTFEGILKGENIVINSETGSGKTLAYALPLLQRIYGKKTRDINLAHPSAVVLLPTLELCYQVGEVFRTVLGLNVSLVSNDQPMLLKDTDVVVSTPQGISTYPYSVLNESETIVIDEADIMIDRRVGKHGRKDPLFKFMNHMLSEENKPYGLRDRQFVFVGATMPDSQNKKSRKAMPYIRAWTPDVRVIKGVQAHKLISNLDTDFVNIDEGNKLKQLVHSITCLQEEKQEAVKFLVFVNTVTKAESLYSKLTDIKPHVRTSSGAIGEQTFPQLLSSFQLKWSNNIGMIHRDVSRDDRLSALQQFNVSRPSMLITTDVSARGLDFNDVDVVIQFDFATNVTDVVHRVGRAGRMGRPGKVINFITSVDERLASLIQQNASGNDNLEGLFSRRRGLSKSMKNLGSRGSVQ